jgi:hypothetical protein
MMPNTLRGRLGIVCIRSIKDFILSGKAKYGIPSITSARPKTLIKYAMTVNTPNPDKPEPKLNTKTNKTTKNIQFGTQELTKVKTKVS